MTRFFKALLGLLLLGWIATFIGGLVLALQLKRNAGAPPDPSSDWVDLVAAFDRLDFRSTAAQFRGGQVACVFGGGILDLRDAHLDPDGAHLQTRTIFGGGEIAVPPAWHVVSTVRGIGGLSDERDEAAIPADAPTLWIDGFALFGGFRVWS